MQALRAFLYSSNVKIINFYAVLLLICGDIPKNYAGPDNISLVPVPCISPGLSCDGCNKLVTCVHRQGMYVTQDVLTCPKDETCLGFRCTKEPNPKCSQQLEFPCNQVGVFPDPFDCRAYHICTIDAKGALVNTNVKCGGSYAYDAKTTLCKIQLSNNYCPEDIGHEFPVDLCIRSGQAGAVRNNPSIYYVCSEHSAKTRALYPFLYVCPGDQVYRDGACADNLINKIWKSLENFFNQ